MESTSVSLTMYCYNIIRGMKRKKGHRSMDSALREILANADIDEEELHELGKKEEYEPPEDWTGTR